MRRLIAPVVLAAGLVPAFGTPSGGAEAKAWALVVGVGRYPLATTRNFDCPNAVADAQAIAGWLTTTAGWPEERVRLMTSDEGPRSKLRPTLENLRAAVSGWLASNVKPGDLVFLYFAGQAIAKVDSDRAAELNKPRDFLLPFDFPGAEVDESGWALDRDLAKAFGDKVQVFCCLDTSTAGRGRRIVETVTPADRWLKSLTPWPGWAAWIAADDGEAAADEYLGRRGSPLRHRIIQGLGTTQSRHNLLACLNVIKEDKILTRARFTTRGRLKPGLTLWSGTVEKVADVGIRPVHQRGHAAPVTGLLAGGDGEGFFSSSEDSTVRIWRAPSGTRPVLERTLSEPIGGVGCLAISPDGRWIAGGSSERDEVWLWDGTGRNIPLNLKGNPLRGRRPIRSIGFLPDSLRFVTIDGDRQAQVWDVATRKSTPWVGEFHDDRDGRRIAFAPASAGASSIAFASLAYDVKGEPTLKLLGSDPRKQPWTREPGVPKPSAVALSGDGKGLALGNEAGDCAIFDVSNPDGPERPTFRHRVPGEKVGLLRLRQDGWLAVGTDRMLRLLDATKVGPAAMALAIPVDEVRRIRFSDDGRLMAAIVVDDVGLRARLWRLENRSVAEIGLGDGEGPVDAPRELAFTGRGRDLIAGCQRGSIRSWTLDDARTKVRTTHRPIPADPAQIGSISASPDGGQFLRIGREDGKAFLFDFERRVSIPLKHRWNSIAFLPDGRLIGILSPKDEAIAGPGGNLGLSAPVIYDLERNRIEPGTFLAPADAASWGMKLDRMAISDDGKWVAVNRREGAVPQELIVWEVASGKPLRRLRTGGQGSEKLTGFAIAPSGDESVVCSLEEATLFDGERPKARLPKLDPDDWFSAAAVAPSKAGAKDSRLIALGTRKNGVVLWSPGAKEEVRVLRGKFDVQVETLAFTSFADRLWLVASGLGKRFAAWELKPDGRAEEISFEPTGLGHDSVIRDVKPWPKLAMVATTGDDATVRFWSLKDRQLIGTLAFSRVGLEEKLGLNWVAFSPDGKFDCPPEARDLLKLVRDGQPIGIDQAVGSLMDDDLMKRIRTASVATPGPAPEPPPSIALKTLSPLDANRVSPNRAIYLELQLDEPNPNDLRLYRNGIPTRGVERIDRSEDDPRRYRASVTLRKGANAFRAVAARGEAIEGSSLEETVWFEGDELAPRMHVLAIGIDKYSKSDLKLEYAVRDAQDLSKRLRDLDARANGEPIEDPILLRVDDQVDEEAIKQAFRRLRDRVRDRPGDKVVVFLAGHTEKFGGDFGLLLSKKKNGANSILKYASILQGLAQLDAEQRLVIVDACQTDQIKSGEEALRFARDERRAIERKTLQFPTQYILASKGLENRELGHGLLTYALLRGLGLPEVPDRLKGDPGSVESFSTPADEDHDGNVSTDELNRYAMSRLPLLLAAYQDSSQTARGKLEDDLRDLRARREADRVRVGSDPAAASFQLVRLPNPAP